MAEWDIQVEIEDLGAHLIRATATRTDGADVWNGVAITSEAGA